MKREIKFRGKRSSVNEWVEGYYFYDGNHNSHNIFTLKRIYEVIPETVGQFTSLKDKNGKEIYEGDQLFICPGYTSTVEFKDSMFVSVYKHPEDGEVIPLIDIIGQDTVVIGNIFEY